MVGKKQPKKQKNVKKPDGYWARSDPRGSQTADEGDTAEAHPPEEDRAGRLHDELLQKNPQLCEQGAVGETDPFNTKVGRRFPVFRSLC